MDSLPVIDISALYQSRKEDVLRVAHNIDKACRTWGFFYITGHHITLERIKELTAMANKFFALPLEEKLKIDITKTKHHRGYGAVAAEQLNPGKTVDYKETFDMSCDLPLDHPDVRAGAPLRGPNAHPDISGWRELMETHYKDMLTLALLLLRALALALDIDESYFSDKFHEPLAVLRLIHYPALHEKERVVCGAHTDYGIMTLLYQDASGGLQVLNLHGEWIKAPQIPGSFVVNIGDMMAMWSNNRYKSTMHRVVSPCVERFSMPFFVEPNPGTVISCLPNCSDADNPPKYPNVRAVDWLQKRFKQTYAYREQM